LVPEVIEFVSRTVVVPEVSATFALGDHSPPLKLLIVLQVFKSGDPCTV